MSLEARCGVSPLCRTDLSRHSLGEGGSLGTGGPVGKSRYDHSWLYPCIGMGKQDAEAGFQSEDPSTEGKDREKAVLPYWTRQPPVRHAFPGTAGGLAGNRTRQCRVTPGGPRGGHIGIVSPHVPVQGI